MKTWYEKMYGEPAPVGIKPKEVKVINDEILKKKRERWLWNEKYTVTNQKIKD